MATYGFRYSQSDSAVDATGTLYVDETSDSTSYTYKFTKLTITAKSGHGGNYNYKVTLGGVTVVGQSNVVVGSGKTVTVTLNATKTFTRTHSNQSVVLQITGSGPNYPCSISYTHTLYAKPSYNVTYNANGGSGAPSSQTKWYGETLTLTASKPTRTGYAFWHWNTSSSNSGTTYASGATYTTNAALSLYAIWNPVISYDANGGSGAPASQTKTYGVAMALSTTRPTRPGYEFAGWGTSASATTVAYAAGASYTSNDTIKLYAIWNPVISYDANGGSGAPSSQTKTRGVALTLRTTKPTRPGYAFSHWNTSSTNSGTTYQSGGTMAAGSNDRVTLYAIWLKEPAAPTISSLTAVRWSGHTSSATGRQDDTGTQCRIVCKWKVDTTSDTVSGNTGTLAAAVLSPSSGVTVGAWTHSTSGGVITSTCYVTGVGTDTQYSVTVSVTDRKPQTTSRTTILTRAEFVIDCKAGGHAVGFACAAPADGMEFGWDAQFDGDVDVLGSASVGGSLVVTGDLSAPQLTRSRVSADVATAGTNWTIVDQYADTYGKVVQVQLRLRPSQAVAANATATIATLKTAYRPALLQGFANQYGIGQVTSGGSVTFRALVALTTSSDVYVALAFLKS